MIRLIDRIFHIQNRRNGRGDLFAVLDGHGAVVALGHDLKRQAVQIEEAHAHEAKAHAHKDGLDDGGDALIKAGFDDQPGFVGIVCVCHVRQAFTPALCMHWEIALIKKSGSLRPTLHHTIKNLKQI